MTEKGSAFHRVLPFFFGAAITVASLCLTAGILRNLGGLIGCALGSETDAKFDFVQIFEQTRRARLSLHWGAPLLCGVLFGVINGLLLPKLGKKTVCVILSIVLGIFLFFVATVCSLAWTKVNDVRFLHLLEKLLPLIDKL